MSRRTPEDLEAQESLLGAQASLEHARSELDKRGDGTRQLLGTTDRLREALRQQAETAKALREREEEKSKGAILRRIHKRKREKKPKKAKIVPQEGATVHRPLLHDDVGCTSSSASDFDADVDESLERVPQPHEKEHTNDGEEADKISQEEVEEPKVDTRTKDDIVREMMARNVDMDVIVETLFGRAETVKRQSEVAFPRMDPDVIRRRKRKRIIIAVVCVVAVLVITCIVIVIVREVHHK